MAKWPHSVHCKTQRLARWAKLASVPFIGEKTLGQISDNVGPESLLDASAILSRLEHFMEQLGAAFDLWHQIERTMACTTLAG